MNDLSGRGSELSGGRWNTKGTRMLYTSSSKALCLVEVLVHIHADNMPEDYFMLALEIKEPFGILEIKKSELELNWNKMPWSNKTQMIGDDFIDKQKQLILKVPSAIVEGEFNFLLNPTHNGFSKLKIKSITPFEFDSRLFKIGSA